MSQDGTGRIRSVIDDFGGRDYFGRAGRGVGRLFDRTDDSASACRCRTSFEGKTLVLDAADCDGALGAASACRRTVVDTLTDRDAERIVVRSNGLEYRYADPGVALLGSAGRFVALLGDRVGRVGPSLVENNRCDRCLEVERELSRVQCVGEC